MSCIEEMKAEQILFYLSIPVEFVNDPDLIAGLQKNFLYLLILPKPAMETMFVVEPKIQAASSRLLLKKMLNKQDQARCPIRFTLVKNLSFGEGCFERKMAILAVGETLLTGWNPVFLF